MSDFPKVTSNLGMSHGGLFESLLADGFEELFWASPFLSSDLIQLLGKYNFASVKSLSLVTTLKRNDSDQITKPNALKSFYNLANQLCTSAKIRLHVNNSLHGKVYIFRKPGKAIAIVTSANLTQNGLFNNHEWGIKLDDETLVDQLQSEIIESIEYPEISEYLVDRLVMFSDQYLRENPDWGRSVVPTSDVLESVYNQSANVTNEPRYYLKPVGVSEDPIYKEHKRDFSDLHQDLAFSKKGTGAIQAGDIVITTAVGCGCLLSCFTITGSPKEATHEEKLENPWKERWPWQIEGRNMTVEYGGSWWEYDLDRSVLLDEYLELYPDKAVTRAGGRTLGTINFGSDKVEITKEFAEFLISKIEARK